jgi:hypothetical protein
MQPQLSEHLILTRYFNHTNPPSTIHHPPTHNVIGGPDWPCKRPQSRLIGCATPHTYLRERFLCTEDSSYRQWFRLCRTDESEGKWRQLLIQGTRQWQSPLPLCDQAATRDKKLMCLSGCGIATLPLYVQPISMEHRAGIYSWKPPNHLPHPLRFSAVAPADSACSTLCNTLCKGAWPSLRHASSCFPCPPPYDSFCVDYQ